jgi:hypothetical protein
MKIKLFRCGGGKDSLNIKERERKVFPPLKQVPGKELAKLYYLGRKVAFIFESLSFYGTSLSSLIKIERSVRK